MQIRQPYACAHLPTVETPTVRKGMNVYGWINTCDLGTTHEFFSIILELRAAMFFMIICSLFNTGPRASSLPLNHYKSLIHRYRYIKCHFDVCF